MSAFGGKADIAAKLLSKDEAPADRGEYRQAAGAIAPPSDVGSAMRRGGLQRILRSCRLIRRAEPLWVLRECHDTTGEHQQTDDLEQHQ
jgi:hypothetical protein